jgi:hypothetical protein
VANEQRAPRDYLSGVLTIAAAISDTTIQSAAFTSLPTNYSSTLYLPLELHDPDAGLYEVVWVTAHAGSSTSVTVVRGREGTSARAWPSGTQVVCAPTVRDTLSSLTRSSLPADGHYGQRVMVSDESVVNERSSVGWLPTVGVAAPAQVGPNSFNLAQFPSASSIIQLRAGTATGTLDSLGQTTISYRTAFPTATTAVIPVSRYTGSKGPIVVYAASASSFSIIIYEDPATGDRASNEDFTVMYVAVGY